MQSTRDYFRDWYARNREDQNNKARQRYNKNKEVIAAQRLTRSDALRSNQLLAAYGIDLEMYNQMLRDQGGLCAVCGLPETRIYKKIGAPRNLAVDHCHDTGVVRGLLCGRCNLALGQVSDSVSLLEEMIRYLLEAPVPEH